MIVGISVVRNEGDIVGQSLAHAARQHDLLLVADVCSTDDTFQEVERVCARFPHVVLVGKVPVPTRAEGVRRHIWSAFRDEVPFGSWWSFVDADEFAEEDLGAAVAEAERERADHIQGVYAQFYLTESEARDWWEGKETLDDRRRPIETRRKHFILDHYSVRLFRHHPRLRWDTDRFEPMGLLRPRRRRAVYRHYPLRDPDQIELRLRTRRELELSREFLEVHPHWRASHEDTLIPDDHPELRIHEPGDPIPDPHGKGLAWVSAPHQRAWRWARAELHAKRTPVEPPRWFGDLPVKEIVARADDDGGRTGLGVPPVPRRPASPPGARTGG